MITQYQYTVNFSDLKELKKCYMPFIKKGGLFIATQDAHSLGNEVFIRIKLPYDFEEHLIEGTVVWINPSFAQYGQEQGIGVQFESKDSHLIKDKIETLIMEVENVRSATM